MHKVISDKRYNEIVKTFKHEVCGEIYDSMYGDSEESECRGSLKFKGYTYIFGANEMLKVGSCLLFECNECGRSWGYNKKDGWIEIYED